MKRVNDCKRCVYNVSARWTVNTDKFTLFVYCNFLVLLSTTGCSQNINKQTVNIADVNLTDYSFLSRYHYTKSKNYLKSRYRIRHWISRFTGTPCKYNFHLLRKKLSLCHKFRFSNPYICAIKCSRSWIFQTMKSVRSNNLSLKYQTFTPSGCKDIRIRVCVKTKSLFLCFAYLRTF